MILSGWSGIVVALCVLQLFKVSSASVNIVGAAFGALFGYVFGCSRESTIKCASSGLIGSYFIIKGISYYAGEYPNGGKVKT